MSPGDVDEAAEKMAKIDPYYIGEITEENEVLFVDREDILEMAMERLLGEEHVALPVIGEIGTGKTSFLNVLQHRLRGKGIKVAIVKADDILQGRVTEDGKIVSRDGITRSEERFSVLLVDDVEKLNEKEAKEVYYKLMKVVANHIKVLFTGRKEWLSGAKEIGKAIRKLSTFVGSYIYMDLKPEDMAYFLEERLRRLKRENRFEKDALIIAGKRANQNLRYFFQYARAAKELKREGRIEEKDMRNAILVEDLGRIEGMGEMEKNILRILVSEGEKTNQELMGALKELMEFMDKTYYDIRNDLEKEGFIRVEKAGRKTIIKDIYRILGIEMTEEMINGGIFYAMKIRRSYRQNR